MKRSDARLDLLAFDRQHSSPTVTSAVVHCSRVLQQMSIGPYEKAIAAALLVGNIAVLMDQAFADPHVQEHVHQFNDIGPVLRRAADMFDALYKAGRN